MNKENQAQYNAFIEKVKKQEVYFLNTYEEAAIRSVPTKTEGIIYYVKFKGEKTFQAEKGSTIIADALLEYKEITKEEYNSY